MSCCECDKKDTEILRLNTIIKGHEAKFVKRAKINERTRRALKERDDLIRNIQQMLFKMTGIRGSNEL